MVRKLGDVPVVEVVTSPRYVYMVNNLTTAVAATDSGHGKIESTQATKESNMTKTNVTVIDETLKPAQVLASNRLRDILFNLYTDKFTFHDNGWPVPSNVFKNLLCNRVSGFRSTLNCIHIKTVRGDDRLYVNLRQLGVTEPILIDAETIIPKLEQAVTGEKEESQPEKEKVVYRYTRVKDGDQANKHKSVSWAFTIDFERNKVIYAATICNPKHDQFSKKKAREILGGVDPDAPITYYCMEYNNIHENQLVGHAINDLRERHDERAKKIVRAYEEITSINHFESDGVMTIDKMEKALDLLDDEEFRKTLASSLQVPQHMIFPSQDQATMKRSPFEPGVNHIRF